MNTSNEEQNKQLQTFKEDVLRGLKSEPKYLQSKYFYDANGDKLFQQIMASPDYYLTDVELEIFNTRCNDILQILSDYSEGFDFIELGAGDALKTSQLLKCLLAADLNFTYYPIDISDNVVKLVEQQLPTKIPGLKIKGIQGEYFEGLKKAADFSDKPKLVLFLGGNIGNMPPSEAEKFLLELNKNLFTGDTVIIGFDLKKNPWAIFNAYNDAEGITKEFNLNLLRRINRELYADFDIEQFDHYESYDPETGACKSYLISLSSQAIRIEGIEIPFEENEHIFMETSQKYSVQQVDLLAKKAGFKKLKHLFDGKKWFTDAIWRKI